MTNKDVAMLYFCKYCQEQGIKIIDDVTQKELTMNDIVKKRLKESRDLIKCN